MVFKLEESYTSGRPDDLHLHLLRNASSAATPAHSPFNCTIGNEIYTTPEKINKCVALLHINPKNKKYAAYIPLNNSAAVDICAGSGPFPGEFLSE